MRLLVVNRLLLRGINGCRFGGRMGTVFRIIYFGLFFEFRNVSVILRCLAYFLCLVLLVVFFMFMWRIVFNSVVSSSLSSFRMVCVFIFTIKVLLLNSFSSSLWCFLLMISLCFKLVGFGFRIMYAM